MGINDTDKYENDLINLSLVVPFSNNKIIKPKEIKNAIPAKRINGSNMERNTSNKNSLFLFFLIKDSNE